MARWQQRARLGFGLFAAGFAVLLWWVIDERRTPPAAAPVTRLDPQAISEIKGGDVVQVKGAKRDIRVEFATQVLYTDGSAKYTGFKAHIDDRGGRAFEITGAEAHVAAEQSAIDVRGNVSLNTSDGLTARTDQATFSEADGILRGDGPIQFVRDRTKGSGVGFTYDRSIDRLALQNQAVVDVAPGPNGGAMSVRSGSAAYSRAERFLRFERGMRMDRDGQIIEATDATVFLLPDRDEPRIVELRGNSTIRGAAGASALQQMQARDINLTYADDGRTLEHALLVGEGRLTLTAAGHGAGQELRGDTLDLTLGPDGAVTQLLGRDNVRVTLPATASAAAREVTSQSLTGSGRGGQGLDQMLFENNVLYREDVPGGDPRVVRARTLNARLSETGAIDEALFSGGFRYEHGTLRAESLEAIYRVSEGRLALRGPDSAKPPTIKNERVDLRNATTIDVQLSPLALVATGKVQAVFAPGKQEGERGTTLFSDREAIVVLCDKLTFDEATGAGTYAGNARIMQDSGNTVRGDLIEMNEKTGTLTATGKVLTSLPIGDSADKKTTHSTGRAEVFEFDDRKRRAVFAKQAQLDGPEGNISANRIELLLADESNALQQLTATGSVIIFVEDRKASGEALVYHPSDERYVLNGTPVRLTRSCQQSTGRTLTFYRGSERVLVDGQESRVQTTGGKCPEPTGR